MNCRELIIQESSKLKELHENIDLFYKKKGLQKEYKNACKEFNSYRSPIMDYFSKDSLDLLKLGAKDQVDFALTFLEVDPYFFRSGYLKEDLLKKIKKVKLSNANRLRLSSILINAVKKNHYREFKYYCRVAKYQETVFLEEKLNELLESKEIDIQNRAKLMLESMRET